MARRFADAKSAAAGTDAMAHLIRTTEYAHGRTERYFREIDEKISKLQRAGRQRELLEDLGDKFVRTALFRDDLDARELDLYLHEAELVGHVYAIRSGLLATVLHHKTSPENLLSALERLRLLDGASNTNGPIGFRYALGELCDALLAGDRTRLTILHNEASQIEVRSRAWIPVDMFLETIGLPLPPMPTQWLEEPTAVKQRWAGHLSAYLARHRTT